ncbi:MAG: DUF1566 domain-containing protein [Gammaproteobacteria bacterium]|nr:DUF1566 domain-containing protein [Gammaproteobacteria bacterium]MBU1725881.1 DUF1566 domain-containing protein [Gammaproteobacteria bacterium]MBU2006005.1 DUF1566 domain-containing protein [Gammaproteobacteria bacterium]
MSKHQRLLLLSCFLLFPTMVSAQECLSSMPVTTAHMVGNDNGTVTDPKTGLVWKRCSEGQSWNGSTCDGTTSTYTWQAALQRVQAVNTTLQTGTENQDFTDWRLPNIKELQSLIERKCYGPAINITNFPNTPAGANEQPPWYWSSTPVANATQAWAVSSYDGNSYLPKNFSDKTDSNYVRLVRGGH